MQNERIERLSRLLKLKNKVKVIRSSGLRERGSGIKERSSGLRERGSGLRERSSGIKERGNENSLKASLKRKIAMLKKKFFKEKTDTPELGIGMRKKINTQRRVKNKIISKERGSGLRERSSGIKERGNENSLIASLKRKIAMLKKKFSVLDNAENAMDETGKDYSLPRPKVRFMDKNDLAKAKDKALALLPETMLVEARNGYKKAISLIWKKVNKNLAGEHILKSALFGLMTEMKVSRKVAIGIIETAFERTANTFLDSILKRADEIVTYEPEVIAQMALEEGNAVLIIPEGSDIDIDVKEEEDEDIDVKEEESEEVFDRVVEGSFRIPKTNKEGSLLSRAIPTYYGMNK